MYENTTFFFSTSPQFEILTFLFSFLRISNIIKSISDIYSKVLIFLPGDSVFKLGSILLSHNYIKESTVTATSFHTKEPI